MLVVEIGEGSPTSRAHALSRFLELVAHARDELRVLYLTDQAFLSIWGHVAQDIVPEPDAIAAVNGTELWLPPWTTRDSGYERYLELGWNRLEVQQILEEDVGLSPSSARHQRPFRLSYIVPDRKVVDAIRQRLDLERHDVRLLYHGGEHLDVYPMRANNRGVVTFLLLRWGLRREQVVVCVGDELGIGAESNSAWESRGARPSRTIPGVRYRETVEHEPT
jgi:hypothetical protein